MIDYYSEFGEQKFVPLAHAMNVANDGGHQDINDMSASLASFIDETVKCGPKLHESSMFPNMESASKVGSQYPMASASESYISLPTSTITNPSLYSFSNPSQRSVKHAAHKATYPTQRYHHNVGENNSPNAYNLNPLSPRDGYYDNTFTSSSQLFESNDMTPYDSYNCYSPIQGPYILSPPNSSPEMAKSSQWSSPVSQNNIITTTQCNQVPSYNKHGADWGSLGESLNIDTSPYVPFPFSLPSPESKSPVTNDMARINILDIDVCRDGSRDKSPLIEVDIGHFLPKKDGINDYNLSKDGLKKRSKRGRPKGSKSVKNKNSMLSLLGQPLTSECKRTKVSKPRDMNPGIKARARSKSSLEELMQHIPQLFDKEAAFNKRGSTRGRGAMRMCKTCANCLRTEDCAVCVFCKDKSKFGGSNKLKQKCLKKQCVYKGKFVEYDNGGGRTPHYTVMKKNHNPPPPPPPAVTSSPSSMVPLVTPLPNLTTSSATIPTTATLKHDLNIEKPHFLSGSTADKMPFIQNEMLPTTKELGVIFPVKQEKHDVDPLDAAVETFLADSYFPSLDNFTIDC